ncbi:MAG: putative ABC transporter permease subunit [Anaerolineales bacterium]
MKIINSSLMHASNHAAEAGILPSVWKLLVLRLRITYNGFRHAKLGNKIRIIFVWVLLLGFAYFILSTSRWLLGLMRSPEFVQYAGVDLRGILASIPALTLTALFIGTLLTSFGVLLQALYLSGDMDFLLATPLPIRAVFIAKLLQAVLPNFALFSLFGVPVLFGLGIFNGYNVSYYPLVILLMIFLALAASGLSSLLVMLVVRVLPPRRAVEILGFIGAMLAFLCSQTGNLANSFGRDINFSGTRIAALLILSNTRWLPLNWAGQGLVALGEGHWLSGLVLVGATLGFTTVAFWFALITAERLYYSGWAGMQVVARKKIRSSRPANTTGNGLVRLLPRPVLAIVQKDFLTLRRDLRNLSQLVSPVIFGAMYTLILLRSGGEPPAGRGEAPGWFMESFRIVLAYGNIGMSLFVGWMLLSRLAGMGFSQEGRNYWMLKVSPIRVGHLLASKFLVAYLPTLGLGFIFLTVISIVQGLSILEFVYSFIAILMCLAGMAGMLLSFGVAGANFTWDDPRKMNSGMMGCFGQILTIIYLPLSFGLFIAPLGFAQFLEYPLIYGYLVGLILGSAFAAGFAFIPLWLVRRRVEQLGA